jgi:hypothetical protein
MTMVSFLFRPSPSAHGSQALPGMNRSLGEEALNNHWAGDVKWVIVRFLVTRTAESPQAGLVYFVHKV